MNEREKLEMVKMCVDALLEGKRLEFQYSMNSWLESKSASTEIIAGIMSGHMTYRIAKPAVKVRYRNYAYVYDGQIHIGVTNKNVTDEFMNKLCDDFRGWIGDWQEVEIEE